MGSMDGGAAADPALDIRSLNHQVRHRPLFSDLALTVPRGSSVAVLGPSGSGKSTLLSCVLGLVKPQAGLVRVSGTDVTKLKHSRLAAFRSRAIGMVFQFGELLPELSPVENVALAALLSRTDRSDVYERSRQLLRELGVPLADTTEELSGGERQRTAVARALINTPTLLLADEPTGALDAATRDRVADLLFSLPERRGCGLLVVTHDMDVAVRADRVLALEGGALNPVRVGGAGVA